MSTLIGTSQAVVVGSGAGPGPVAPAPPQAATACWTNPGFLDTWANRSLVGQTGCASSGYPWTDDGGGLPGVTVGSGTWRIVIGPPPAGPGGNGANTEMLALPLDPQQSVITFPLQQTVAETTGLLDSNDGSLLVFEVSRYDGFGVDVLSFDILTGSYSTPPLAFPDETGDFTAIRVNSGLPGGPGYAITPAWLLTTPQLVTITITPTTAALSVAGLYAYANWTPSAADPSTVFGDVRIEASLFNGGAFDSPTPSPDSAFLLSIGPITLSTPLGNCLTVPRC